MSLNNMEANKVIEQENTKGVSAKVFNFNMAYEAPIYKFEK